LIWFNLSASPVRNKPLDGASISDSSIAGTDPLSGLNVEAFRMFRPARD
jgi:hypothetical protein